MKEQTKYVNDIDVYRAYVFNPGTEEEIKVYPLYVSKIIYKDNKNVVMQEGPGMKDVILTDGQMRTLLLLEGGIKHA